MPRLSLLLLLLPFFFAVSTAKPEKTIISRSQFPKGFLFGAASSAYQYEGAVREGGRGPSIWDTYTHTHPEKIANGSNGDIAIDSYHRYQEDVKIMKHIGFNAYRFSISWTRILPNGKLSGGINMEGIKYYDNLINKLISEGVEPFVTLFHWDSPQALEQQYGGFLSQHIVEDFRDYANICFREFGDRVKNWITFNEPWSFSVEGYASGILAPGRCSSWKNSGCSIGDSGKEPYIVAHNQLLAHAAAVQVYRDKYQAGSPWLYIYPKGIEELLLYTKKTYNNPTIYITENGVDEINNENLPLQEALVDNTRIEFYRQHLFHIQRALKEGADVRGYFAWSLFDNFEWMDGYTVRFGINYIDYKDGLKRYPKHSSKWFQDFLHR